MNCKHEFVFAGKGVVSLCGALVVSGVLFLPGKGAAQVPLSDGGSSAIVNLGGGSGNIGMNNWSVLGQNQLNQQWFWFQTDGGVAQPINAIGGLTYSLSGNNFLDATYANSQLSVEIQYALHGGGVGSGSADLTESIYVVNLSGAPLTLNFYEYSDFNLLQSGNNSVQIFGSPGAYSNVQQTSGSTAIQEAIVSPFANYAEAANAGQTLNELNTQSGLVLNDTTSAGPGNVTWAFQWLDLNIAPGGELDIFKDKSLSIQMVPEPSTFAFIALGLGAWGLARRRQSS